MAKYFILKDLEPYDSFDKKSEAIDEVEHLMGLKKNRASIFTVENIDGDIIFSNDPEWQPVEKTYEESDINTLREFQRKKKK
jgi:hypothetical protein